MWKGAQWCTTPFPLKSGFGAQVTDEGLDIGSSVTLSSLLATLKACVASRPRHQTSALRAMAEQLKYFAGKPWRCTLLGQLPSSGLKWRAC